ncbi:MAG: hypothetical protein GC181_16480, partial [Bacteroidetes bacterium]|nr:hypothetical protein [Bacteroidota bacterium]
MKTTTAINLFTILTIFLFGTEISTAKTLYVDVHATGSNKGSNWPNALIDFQDALDSVMAGKCDTVLIAEGIYYPNQTPDNRNSDSLNKAFHWANQDAIIIGGYNPTSGIPGTGSTVLSGDLVTAGYASDSAYHVMILFNISANSELRNVTITNGKSNSSSSRFTFSGRVFYSDEGNGLNLQNCSIRLTDLLIQNNFDGTGSGILIYRGAPGLKRVRFVNNRIRNIAGRGAGLYVNYTDSLRLDNCEFEDNSIFGSVASGQIQGAGIYSKLSNKIMLHSCNFKENSINFNGSGIQEGAAICDNSSDYSIIKCVFESNQVNGNSASGGAVLFFQSDLYMSNCIFTKNSTSSTNGDCDGGAFFMLSSSATIESCSFIQNRTYSNHSSCYGGAIKSQRAALNITNCLFYANSAWLAGGAVSVEIDGSLEINASTFINNSTDTFFSNRMGSAVFQRSDSTGKISNSVFYGNTANSIVNDVWVKNTSGSNNLSSSSTHNASDSSSSILKSVGSGFIDLSSFTLNNLFLNPTDAIGNDSIWGTRDDGFFPNSSSALQGAASSSAAPSKDITDFPRPASPTIGAYEYLDYCSISGNNIYVDVNASGNHTGTSWTNAFTDFQDALDVAMNCSGVDSILVAQGNYYPRQSPDNTNTDKRNFAFHIHNQAIKIIGSVDPVTNKPSGITSVLNGDLVTPGIASDSAYHVFVAVDMPSSFRMSNFIVANGKARISGSINYASTSLDKNKGGGFYIINDDGKFNNLIFIENRGINGGGCYLYNSPSVFINCVMVDNSATRGGGIYCDVSHCELQNCTFFRNSATTGGGLYNHYVTLGTTHIGTAVLKNSLFLQNSANTGGSVAVNNGLNPILSGDRNGADKNVNLLPGSYKYDLSSFPVYEIISNENPVGEDLIWGTRDDGLIPVPGSLVIKKTTSGVPSKDVTDLMRYNNTSLGAYEFDSSKYTFLNYSQCSPFVYHSPNGDSILRNDAFYLDTTSGSVGDSILVINFMAAGFASFDTVSPNVCDSFISPSGNIWTTSGNYSDTINNASGCDSIIAVNLNVRHKTYATSTPDVCDSFISPSGNIWTTSGNYIDTINNAAGCDSIISVHLTIRHKTYASITKDVCDSYVSPSGKIWTTSGNYSDTINNAAGCDSIISVNLNVRHKTYATISPNVCDSFISPSGKIWTSSGNYSDTINNAAGCDSIISVNLIVRQKTYATISPDVCDSYVSPSGKIWTTSGNYSDTLNNAAGCDSIISVNLIVRHTTYATVTQTAVGYYTSASGLVFTHSGNYQDTITNTAGCDSITTYHITIVNRLFVDQSASSSGTGANWSQAFNSLSDALAAANQTNNHVEIWVKAGTHTPALGRTSTFLLTNINTRLYGGFNGSESSRDQRDPANNRTVLSGDIGIPGNSSDNCFHVLSIIDTRPVSGGEEPLDTSFVIDGFVISGANANGSSK